MLRDIIRLGILVLLGLMFSSGDPSPLVLFMGFASIAASSAFANVVNDIYDLELDKKTKAYRPLPSGRYSVGEAWGASIGFLVIALSTGAIAFMFSESIILFAVLLAAPLGCFAYSGTPIRLKARSWLGVGTISLIYLTPLITGFVIGGSSSQGLPLVLLMLYTIFLASAVKDFEDVQVDGSMGVTTPPVRYGTKATAKILGYAGIVGVALAGAISAWYLAQDHLSQGLFSLALIPSYVIYVRRIRSYSESISFEQLMILVKGCLRYMYIWPFVAALAFLLVPRFIG
ncbi:MAG: UbiA family prenyltransferase [Theionarchaea archaeon]|nr:UbiA family prenyltransferase [Theionarchaea archaeon]